MLIHYKTKQENTAAITVQTGMTGCILICSTATMPSERFRFRRHFYPAADTPTSVFY
ncbi:hypothetical protein [Neisseria meningitidis]|uniref:hypothetical protein n=1 Tax=Neisseria meningitidis TaxID=487 RepID=UPI000312CA7A|nr:hypothetical protein [Neisseria meningitidis]